MRLRWGLFALGAGGLASLAAIYVAAHPYVLLAFSTEPLKPPTPPLLENASATGGWGGIGCPRGPSDPPLREMSEARSPEVEDRLTRRFPPGTPEAQLKRALVSQHFQMIGSCEADTSIHRATFSQTGGGFYGPYPAWAVVAWKIDAAEKIVWTKADVEYTGP